MKAKRCMCRMAGGVFVLAVVNGAFAQTVNWTNTVGGSWQEAGNWNPGTVPAGAGVIANFNAAGTYTVTLNDNVTVDRLDGRYNNVHLTFDVNGYTFDNLLDTATWTEEGMLFAYSGSATVITQEVTLTSSQPGGVIRSNRMRWGSGNRPASVTMTGANLTVEMDGTAGDNGFNYSAGGRTVMSGGVTVNATRAFIFGNGSQTVNPDPVWLITDPGTVVSNSYASAVYIGKSSEGMPTVIVTNGAIFTAPSGTFRVAQGGDSGTSYNTNANARLIVSGAGSLVDSLYLNISEFAGNGTLTREGYDGTGGAFILIENGGTITNRGGINIGRAYNGSTTAGQNYTNANAYGEIEIRGAGAALRGSGSVQVGRASQGAIRVVAGGEMCLASGVNIELARPWYPSNSGSGLPNYTNTQAYGLLVVSNAGSRVECRALLVGGSWDTDERYGYGDVIVADGASLLTVNTSEGIYLKPRCGLTVSDAYVESQKLSMNSNSTLRVELGARDHSLPYLKLRGNLELNYQNATGARNLEIGVLDSFAAVNGATIAVAEFAARTGNPFANVTDGEIIDLGKHRFRYNETATNITLSVMLRGTMIRVL